MAVTGTTLGGGYVANPTPPVYNGPGATSQGAQGGTTPSGTDNSTTSPATGLTDALTGATRDAGVFLTNLFTSYGLGSLAPQIIQFLKNGYSSDTVAIMLQETPEYQARFAGNKARLAKGLPVLSPAEYISTENSYRQIMSANGMPAGFWDSQDDFTKLIEGDVSPTELQGRVQVASNLINSLDPATTQKFAQFYGGSQNLVAYALDAKTAEPLLEKQYQAAQIAAQDQGLGVSQAQAEQLAGQGVTQGQAQSGFGFIGENLQPTQELGAISGETYTLQDALDETFGNNADAALKRRRLVNQEQSRFRGTTAVGQGSLNTAQGGQI